MDVRNHHVLLANSPITNDACSHFQKGFARGVSCHLTSKGPAGNMLVTVRMPDVAASLVSVLLLHICVPKEFCALLSLYVEVVLMLLLYHWWT